jgi:RNA polymerase sigma-70 factor (family 1)
LCAYANSFISDLDAAEEIVQELFVRFWEQRETKEITTSIRAYFYASVRNACLNELKHLKIKEKYKQEQERELTFNVNQDQHNLELNELDEKIHTAINKLPEGRRKIFILSRFDGLKYQEIADKLNISIKTVENQMGEALKFLRVQLKDFIVTLLVLLKLFTHF